MTLEYAIADNRGLSVTVNVAGKGLHPSLTEAGANARINPRSQDGPALPMIEQMGDVVREVERPPVVKWYRHTRRSRAIWLAAFAFMVAIIALSELTRGDAGPPWHFSAMVIVVLLVQRLARRWQVETVRPAPQTPADKRSYSRLQYIELAMIIAGCGPLMWMLFDPTDSTWHSYLRGLAAFALAAYLIAQRFMVRAYDRLFTRIAANEGAYGF